MNYAVFLGCQVLSEKRRLGSRDGPPHLVAVIGLHAQVDAAAVTRLLRADGIEGVLHQPQGDAVESQDSFGLVISRFKQRFTFYRPDTGNPLLHCCSRIIGINVIKMCFLVTVRLVMPISHSNDQSVLVNCDGKH